VDNAAPKIHTKPGKPPGQEVVCPDCGHKWFSRGQGKYYKCPNCYHQETGRSYGEHFKKTKGLTMKVVPETPGQADPLPITEQDPAQNPPASTDNSQHDQGNTGGIKGFFRTPLLKI